MEHEVQQTALQQLQKDGAEMGEDSASSIVDWQMQSTPVHFREMSPLAAIAARGKQLRRQLKKTPSSLSAGLRHDQLNLRRLSLSQSKDEYQFPEQLSSVERLSHRSQSTSASSTRADSPADSVRDSFSRSDSLYSTNSSYGSSFRDIALSDTDSRVQSRRKSHSSNRGKGRILSRTSHRNNWLQSAFAHARRISSNHKSKEESPSAIGSSILENRDSPLRNGSLRAPDEASTPTIRVSAPVTPVVEPMDVPVAEIALNLPSITPHQEKIVLSAERAQDEMPNSDVLLWDAVKVHSPERYVTSQVTVRCCNDENESNNGAMSPVKLNITEPSISKGFSAQKEQRSSLRAVSPKKEGSEQSERPECGFDNNVFDDDSDTLLVSLPTLRRSFSLLTDIERICAQRFREKRLLLARSNNTLSTRQREDPQHICQNMYECTTARQGVTATMLSPGSPHEKLFVKDRKLNSECSELHTLDDQFAFAVDLHQRGELVRSLKYLRAGSLQGHIPSRLLYSLALRHGWGCKVQMDEAVLLLQSAAKSVFGNIERLSRLAPGQRQKKHDDTRDPLRQRQPNARKSLKSVQKDEQEGQQRIATEKDWSALMSFELEGNTTSSMTVINRHKELKQLRSQMGLSLLELGNCFFHGWSLKRNRSKSIECYELASEYGDRDAQIEAAQCYFNGSGTRRNKKKAATYFLLAEKQGAMLPNNTWIHKPKYAQ